VSWRRALVSIIPEHRWVSTLSLALARGGAVVFMLHRVLPRETVTYDNELVTSADLFEALVNWLAAEFEIVSLEEISERIEERKSLKRACALTFDDGWLDNYTHAFPVLRKAKTPATIFLASGYIGSTRRLWQEKLWYLLKNSSGHYVERFATDWSAECYVSLVNNRKRDFVGWRAWLLNLGSDRAEDFVDKLEKAVGNSSIPRERTFMSWDEIREMHGAGVEFGAHTVNHVFLPRATMDEVRSEIAQSCNTIERQTGAAVTGFAYPWGALTSSIRDCVESAGLKYAVGIQPGAVHADTNKYLLPRIFVATSVLGSSKGFSSVQTALYVASQCVKRCDRAHSY